MDKPPEQVQHQYIAAASAAAAAATSVFEERARAKATLRRRRWVRCCACFGASFLFSALLTVTLAFTAFRVRGPGIFLHGCVIAKSDLANGTNRPPPGANATAICDVSMKNRNYASFRHGNLTGLVYHRGALFAEAHVPALNMRARRTERINVTVTIIVERVAKLPDLGAEAKTGTLRVSWYTRMSGRAKVLILKKHMKVRMNCTGTLDLINNNVRLRPDFYCKQKLRL